MGEDLEIQPWGTLTFKTQAEEYASPANFATSELVCHTDYLRNLKLKNTFALLMNIYWKSSFCQINS